MFNFLSDFGNHEERLVDNTQIDGSTEIDTCAVSDGNQPYETAVKNPKYNQGKWVIVEAYDTKEEAKAGHNKWVGIMSAENLPEKLVDCLNSEIAQLGKAIGGDDWETEFESEF